MTKCPHFNCLVAHNGGECRCDMARYCPECKAEKNDWLGEIPEVNDIGKNLPNIGSLIRVKPTESNWEQDFKDFYYESGKYAGRPLGIEQYIEFIKKVEEEAYRKGYEAGLKQGWADGELDKLNEN